MTADQLEAIEDSFGDVDPVAKQAASARDAARGLFADFMIAEAHVRSLAARRKGR